MSSVLLFGGTTEGRRLAMDAATLGMKVTLCVATDYGKSCLPPATHGVTVLTGRMTTEDMTVLMRKDFSAVVDATHPYAVVVSQNIKFSCEHAQISYWRLLRAESSHDGCLYASSVKEACKMANSGNVLMATGSKEISQCKEISDFKSRVFARVLPLDDSIDACHSAGLADDHILAEKGPFTLEQNIDTLKKYNICTMITKDSGATGGFPEKLEAARISGATVIVVRRPQESGQSYEEILTRLEALA